MYYIIRWYGDAFLVYDTTTGQIADSTSLTVLGAITQFNLSSWNIATQPRRFVFTEDAVLEHSSNTGKFKRAHPIAYKFNSLELSYLQQHYPELLI